MSTTQLYQRLSGALNIDIEECSEQEKQTLTAQLLEFGVYMKKAAPFLKKMKDEMATYVTGKQAIFTSYGGVASTLTSYEEFNMNYYSSQNGSKLVISNHENGNLVENMKHTVENLRNPFTDLYHWVKGEIYDLAAFQVAVNELKSCADGVTSANKKIQ